VHVLKNGLISMITLVVAHLPLLILGALLVESFFGIPGLGSLLVRAIGAGDWPWFAPPLFSPLFSISSGLRSPTFSMPSSTRAFASAKPDELD
jgi:ABC-type dipeptide/oligopeptide/nickel transport system permease component